jgi:hypothetical protein
MRSADDVECVPISPSARDACADLNFSEATEPAWRWASARVRDAARPWPPLSRERIEGPIGIHETEPELAVASRRTEILCSREQNVLERRAVEFRGALDDERRDDGAVLCDFSQ